MPATPLNDHIHLWIVLTGDSYVPRLIEHCRTLLPPQEICRSDRFIFEKDRHQFLFSHAFVRFVLSKYFDVEPAEWRFVKNKYGKPRVSDEFPRLCFNLTHTTGLVACAVSHRHDLGVDAEEVTRTVESGIARAFFSSSEVEYLEQVPVDQRNDVFFQIWTLKESYIKAVGLGLSIPLDSFAVRVRPGVPPALSFVEEHSGDPSAWQFFEVRPSPRHRLAVCARRQSQSRSNLLINRMTPLDILDSNS